MVRGMEAAGAARRVNNVCAHGRQLLLGSPLWAPDRVKGQCRFSVTVETVLPLGSKAENVAFCGTMSGEARVCPSEGTRGCVCLAFMFSCSF